MYIKIDKSFLLSYLKEMDLRPMYGITKDRLIIVKMRKIWRILKIPENSNFVKERIH